MEMKPASMSRVVMLLLAMFAATSFISSISTATYCTNHAMCSQECGGSFNYGVYGCCSGNNIGQCNLNTNTCYCSYSPSYCSSHVNPSSCTSGYYSNYYGTNYYSSNYYPYNYYTTTYPYYYSNYYSSYNPYNYYNNYYHYPTQTATQPAPNFNFVISIAPSSQTASAGQTVTYTVTVTNTGTAADTYTLSTTYGTLGTSSAYLGPGGSQSIVLLVSAPNSGGLSIVVSASSTAMAISKPAYATLNSIPTFTTTMTSNYCTPKWLGSYSCNGNYQTQLYQNPDCSQTYMNAQYCQYGCSGGACQNSNPIIYQNLNYPYYPNYPSYPSYPSTCQASVSITTPRDAYQGDFVSTTATITNSGGSTGTINLNSYICYADGSNCQPIYCSNSLNPSITVPSFSTATVSCGVRTGTGNYGYANANTNAPYTNPPVGYNSNYYSGNYYNNYYNGNYGTNYNGNYYYPGYNYNYGNYYVTNTATLPYYSTPYNIYPYAYPYYYNYNPYSYSLAPGTYRIRMDWNGCGISDPTMYTGPFQILPYQTPAAASTIITTTTTTPAATTATSTTAATSATTATTTTVYLWPFHIPGSGLVGRITAKVISVLPSLRTILVILLVILVIVLIVLLIQWHPAASSNRGEEEAFHAHYGQWSFMGTIKGKLKRD